MNGLNWPKLICGFRTCLRAVYIHQSAKVHRYDKYNFAKKASRKIQKNAYKKTTNGPEVFQLDPLRNHNSSRVHISVRRKTLATTLQDSINTILNSSDVPVDLQAHCVDVTEVHVSPDCSRATVRWKVENEESEFIVENLLKVNIERIRMILPTYHHLTYTPCIHFEKDKKGSYLRRLDLLFSTFSRKDYEK